MKTITVIEGFTGGPLLSRRFRQALKKAGFKLTKSKHKADIIIAHSAGCYALPLDVKADLIMFIGPPYWPGVPVLKRTVQKYKSDRQAVIASFGKKYFLQKQFLEFYYFLSRPRHLFLTLTNHAKLDFLELGGKNIILVRNKNDKFCSAEIENVVKSNQGIKFYELPGEHDDYYTNPKPYIDILNREL